MEVKVLNPLSLVCLNFSVCMQLLSMLASMGIKGSSLLADRLLTVLSLIS